MTPRPKISPASTSAAAAADFDWDAGRDYHPDQKGHEREVFPPLDEEEMDTVAAARCWLDYALSDCWAPLFLCNPKRRRITLEERPSIEADRLRHWWEVAHEEEHPTLYCGPNPPDELLDIFESRGQFCFYEVIEESGYCHDDDGDYPDDDGNYVPSNDILQAWAWRHETPPSTPPMHSMQPLEWVPSPSLWANLDQLSPESRVARFHALQAPPEDKPAPKHGRPSSTKGKRKLGVPKPSQPSIPRSSLLDRFMGLDPKLSYRTRILVMHWAALQMTRADGHKSWKLSGFIPFDPGIVLEPLGSERTLKQSSIKQSLRLQESQYLQEIQDTANNGQLAADAKFLRIHDILMRALNADVWQRRSIFADKGKKQAAESDSSSDCDSSSSNSDESFATIPAYGAIGADIARRMEKQQIRNEEKLVKSKPFPCKMCAMRYRTQFYLAKHIQDKHPSYPIDNAETCVPSAAINSAGIDKGDASKPKQNKYCDLCGGLANHVANHKKTERHKRAVAAQLLQRA
jgi:hypothetical protein